MEGSGEKQAYQDRLKARIEQWEGRIEELAARARRAEVDLRERLSSEESGLREQLSEARSRLRELIEASEDGWEEIKAGAERIWVDVREAWERAGSVPEKEPSEPSDPTAGEKQPLGADGPDGGGSQI